MAVNKVHRIWCVPDGFDGLLMVSDHGHVFRTDTKKFIGVRQRRRALEAPVTINQKQMFINITRIVFQKFGKEVLDIPDYTNLVTPFEAMQGITILLDWKPVPGHEDWLVIEKSGLVARLDKRKILKPYPSGKKTKQYWVSPTNENDRVFINVTKLLKEMFNTKIIKVPGIVGVVYPQDMHLHTEGTKPVMSGHKLSERSDKRDTKGSLMKEMLSNIKERKYKTDDYFEGITFVDNGSVLYTPSKNERLLNSLMM